MKQSVYRVQPIWSNSLQNSSPLFLSSSMEIGSILKTQTSYQTNVEACRRMQTSHRRMQMSVDESLDECRQVQTSLDESLDECRQMQMSLVAIMQQQATSVCKCSILQFYQLLLLIIVYSLLTLAKPICLFLHLMYVNSN